MKILVLPSFYPNSYDPLVGVFFQDHALALQTAGHDVIVLAVLPISLIEIWKQKKFSFGLSRKQDKGMITYLFQFPAVPKLRWVNNVLRLFIGWHLYRLICHKHGSPDLVHVHCFSAGILARKIKRRDAVPYAITEHDAVFALGLLSYTQKKLALNVFREALVRMAVSEQFVKLLKCQYGLPFLYIPNPVSAFDFPELPLARINKKNGQIIRVCHVARLHAEKRQDRLIRAFSSMVKCYSDAELHIAGAGPEREKLESLVLELGLERQVTFHGMLPRREVFQLMHSCDLFALSSDYETFGVVLIEAMVCGLPVMATRCGGPESIITAEWMGLLTMKDDSSFAQGLLDIAKRVQDNRFDSDRISVHAQTTYSCETIGKRMTELLVHAISKSKSAKAAARTLS